MGGVAAIAKYVNREMADRARDARAVQIERGRIGGPDGFAGIHFHAGEDRQKISFAKLEGACRFPQRTCHEVTRLPAVKRLDLEAPRSQSGELVCDRPVSVGDVVDL